MNRSGVALALLLALPLPCSVAMAEDPPRPVVPVAVIDAPDRVPYGGRLVLLGTGTVSKTPPTWQVIEPANAPFDVQGNALVIKDPIWNTEYLFVEIASGDVPAFAFRFAKVKTDAAPAPKPPTPVDPVVPPGPVDPLPKPDDATVIGNMRVLVLYESSKPRTREQQAAMLSPSVRGYLSAKCLKALDGRAEWRFLDPDDNTENASPEWRAAVAKGKAEATPLPKVIVFAGSEIAAVAPIVDEKSTLAFLESKGGK